MRSDRRLGVALATIATMAMLGLVINNIGTVSSSIAPSELRTEPESERLLHQHFQQGVAMLRAGHFEYAVQSLHEVLAARPEMPEAHVNMGFALLGLQSHAAARDFFQTAIELRPRQYNAYWGLAVASEKAGEIPEAIGAMKTYLHLAPADDSFRRIAEAAIWEWESTAAEAQP